MKISLMGMVRWYGDFVYDHRYLLLLLCGLSFLSIIDIPGSPAFKIAEEWQIFYLVFVSVFKGLLLLTCLYPLLKIGSKDADSCRFKKRWGVITVWLITIVRFYRTIVTNYIIQ